MVAVVGNGKIAFGGIDVWAYLKVASYPRIAGTMDYSLLRQKAWKLGQLSFRRTYRCDERRDTVNCTRLIRTRRCGAKDQRKVVR